MIVVDVNARWQKPKTNECPQEYSSIPTDPNLKDP
jgi:hypothetical protein